MKVYIFHTGKVRVDKAIPLHESNFLAFAGFLRGKDKKVILPVSAYLITHPQGNVLIDTGWDTKYATSRPKQLLGLVDKISAPIIEKDEGIDSKLAQNGFSVKDLKHVYISHMDFDHASGLRLVKDAKDVRTSKEEWAACNAPSLRYVNVWKGICDVKSFEYQKSGIGPVGESFDVYGDGKILLVHTPGHSKGHFSVVVNGENGFVVLGSDAAYVPESFEKEIIPGFLTSKTLAQKSLAWLIECKRNENCKGVFVNHDPTVQEQIIEI